MFSAAWNKHRRYPVIGRRTQAFYDRKLRPSVEVAFPMTRRHLLFASLLTGANAVPGAPTVTP